MQYAPPTRLRKFDLILLDDGSQIQDDVGRKLFLAIQELPQKRFCVTAADFQQLNPISGGRIMRSLCQNFPCVSLQTIHWTSDSSLLIVCNLARTVQPPKTALINFFQDRNWLGGEAYLKRSEEDWKLEITAITYLLGCASQTKAPSE